MAAVADESVATQEPVIMVAEPIIGPEEKAALCQVIDSGWITMGDRVKTFERSFSEMHGARDCVAVDSCTAGLHLILAALGLGPGDEVLVPAMTFVASVNCVLYVGAKPVFVDIASPEKPLMSLEDAAAKCTSRTKAIILVHFAGYLADRESWQSFATERGLLLIEDAAHAAGLPEAGTYGVAAAFSFYGNKNMTTAEGGTVVAQDPNLLERIRTMRGHGLTSGTFQRVASRDRSYDVTMLGFNYRMDELRAAIGLVQLTKLQGWNDKRKTLTALYRMLLAERCPEVQVPFSMDWRSSYHILPVLLPKGKNRQDVIDQLRSAGIQTTIHYPPAHRFSFYRSLMPGISLPKTEDFADRELTLPLHPRLEEVHLDRITRSLAAALAA